MDDFKENLTNPKLKNVSVKYTTIIMLIFIYKMYNLLKIKCFAINDIKHIFVFFLIY